MKVVVNGAGNIGTTLACLLFDFKDLLNISEVIIFKNTPQHWRLIDLEILKEKGITVVLSTNMAYSELITKVDYIFETTANGIGLKNKAIYEMYSNLIGVCAQGSEKGFGIPFMSGIDSENIAKQKFVQVVSCNTHGAASLLQTICGPKLENLEASDFVVVRRSEDIGNHERLVTANVVARHLSNDIGTHHAIDVKDMFTAFGVDCNITSSDITTPSQLMHATRFTITTKNEINENEINEKILQNQFMATSNKFDSNFIYELGRRYGKYGRIFNHAIVLTNNLLVTKNSIKGWAFVPQEGNSIISTLHAFLLQTQPDESENQINQIKSSLLRDEW
jgi:glyceraldehyde-3-phosphate dehydrogenase type II